MASKSQAAAASTTASAQETGEITGPVVVAVDVDDEE